MPLGYCIGADFRATVVAAILFFVLQLNNHDFDGCIPNIDILMPGSGSIGIEPVSLPSLPLMNLTLAGILKNFHRSATQSDNYARVFMSM